MVQPKHVREIPSERSGGVEGNGRLTATLGAILLVLLFIEGLTIVLGIHQYLNWHVIVGAVLIPVVLLKIGATSWRFAKYYWGTPSYKRKGPPVLILRLLGPVVVGLSVAVLVTGVLALVAPVAQRGQYFSWHRISFILWFGAMAIHVLGHLSETVKETAREWIGGRRFRRAGRVWRGLAVVVAVVLGVVLANYLATFVAGWHLY